MSYRLLFHVVAVTFAALAVRVLLPVTLKSQCLLPYVLHAQWRMPPGLHPKSTSSGLIFET